MARSDRGRPTPGIDLRAAVGLGVAFTGAQDLKLKRHDADATITDYLFSRDVDADPAPLFVGALTAWGRRGLWRHAGFQLSAQAWDTNAVADEFIDRGPKPQPVVAPPFRRYRQERRAFFGTLLGRFALPWQDAFDPERAYAYVGAGGGPVHTRVEHGHAGWKLGAQGLVGVSVPLRERLRLRIEGRYTVAPDADSPWDTEWRADTSGVPLWPGFAHLDTRFFDVVLLLDLRL